MMAAVVPAAHFTVLLNAAILHDAMWSKFPFVCSEQPLWLYTGLQCPA